MRRMLAAWTMGTLIAAVLAIHPALSARASEGEKIVLETSSGRLLRVREDGRLRAEHFVPGPQETFTFVPGKDGRVTILTEDGRVLAAEPGGQIRAVTRTGDPTPLKLVRVEENCAALRGSEGWLLLDPAASAGTAVPGDGPRPEQTIRLFRVGHVPSLLSEEFGRLIRKAVVEELGNKGYDKVRTRKKQTYVKVPAPTLRDLLRQERRRVLSMAEEYHIQAQLSGDPDIRVVDMPYLQGYYDATVGALLFSMQATLPLTGRVGYKIPDLLSASTGFRTTVLVTTSGAVRLAKEKGQAALRLPELQELEVSIRELDVANDALNVIHEALEDLINDELREKKDRIREKANSSIRKAVESQKFRSPMLEWLLLPLK